MPGTIILRPIQANLLNENHTFLKMDPYCSVSLGMQEVTGKVCKSGGKTPQWEDQLIFRRQYEPYCTLQVKDKEFFKKDATVGVAQIDLKEIESAGRLTKWYKLGNSTGDDTAGEILVEAIFAADTPGSYKQLPQQQSYAVVPDSHQTYAKSLYPSSIYSPAKKSALGLDAHIYQAPETEIAGYHNRDQMITYPHISHHLSREEYGKMHSRNVERYQPTNRVVPEQKRPPTWEGYRTPEHLRPQESKLKEVEEEDIIKESEAETVKTVKNVGNTGTLDSLGTTSVGKEASTSIEQLANEKVSNAQNMPVTPVSKRREAEEEIQKSPSPLSFFPLIGGVTYMPSNNEAMYKPVYEWPKKSKKVQESAKNARKLSGNSGSTGEKDANNSTLGSLGTVEGTSLNALNVV